MKILLVVLLLLVIPASYGMNAIVNARFEDKKRKLQAVRTASLEVQQADRNLHAAGRSDPAALAVFEQAVDALRSAEAVSNADRFPRRPRSVVPPETD